MLISLEGVHYRGEKFFIKVETHNHALTNLILDAKNGYRVYELFSITRPGDIWKYIWLEVIDVPENISKRVEEKYKQFFNEYSFVTWPEQQIPFVEFDNLFYWAGDDTEPEDECWLGERTSTTFYSIADEAFKSIKLAQKQISESSDLIIQNELSLIDKSQHYYDYDENSPFKLTYDSYKCVTPLRSAEYYKKLQGILDSGMANSIASRGSHDFETIKLICREQIKRMIDPKKILGISVLCNGLDYTLAWGAKVWFYSEGVGESDLWIEQDRMGETIKCLVEKYDRKRAVYLSHIDEGEIEGYTHEQGDGWHLYLKVNNKDEI